MITYLVRNQDTGEYLTGSTIYDKRWTNGLGRCYSLHGMAKRSVNASLDRIRNANWEIVAFELKEIVDVRKALGSI